MSSEIILYNTEDGRAAFQLKAEQGSVWLTQVQLADLFETTVSNINKHIKAILDEGEQPEATIERFSIVQTEGERSVTRLVAHYALPMILAVGFRVRSPRGSQFRRWAAASLSEYLVKGFVMDDAKLKDPQADYFEELLARIRDIRSSEKLFYQKVLAIYSTSADYDPRAEATQTFFATVQNKMHWAAHGHTAAEIVAARANAAKDHMGLTSWGNQSKDGAPRKSDVPIAKNYLAADEIEALNRIVTAYLEFAELQAMSRKAMTMQGWITKLDDFLRLGDRDILTHAGKVSAEVAKAKALAQYDQWHVRQIDAPSAVETAFLEATQKAKTIGAGRPPRPSKPKPKGKGK
ncbi:virulence RhuM family protein [Novosphingobium sp. P6W]|uniref:virulence RhuM family protein n=1 Tax=Novosphingobium sp. P6W TaxID=1609758 RepID=UPI0005C315EB|nr:virulence RhuM family protein [Novosphingobium sp. P6W]AXB77871.1 hydroxyacid dehydrogenase [Novosphingobium sp. P6W]KIS29843.1 2-hydroxyacid dehydrogenase [Novosphingobium sp. P6W]